MYHTHTLQSGVDVEHVDDELLDDPARGRHRSLVGALEKAVKQLLERVQGVGAANIRE